ncbi:MAG: hypothetical protein JWR75_1516 [Devosia sp.]|nr:hypothetical protein [Devosia sp.]
MLPTYFIPRPRMLIDLAVIEAFEQQFEMAMASDGAEFKYEAPAPLWQFLSYLTDTKAVLLHGSGDGSIAEFEPRLSDDVEAFGDRKAVYAASDGLWPLYFAVLDRPKIRMSILNSSMRIRPTGGIWSEPFYFFSISDTALAQRPYRRGTIYLLPRESFEQQAPINRPEHDIQIAQWASLVPIRPLARLSVGPEDFPLLDQIRGHDDDTTFARARANPEGFPWIEEQSGS